MSELVKFLSLSNPLGLCSDHFSGQPEGINKDPTVWLDGAKPTLRYVFQNNFYEFDKLENFINSDPMLEFTFKSKIHKLKLPVL